MSGSKGGSRPESDSSDDIAARISASIGSVQGSVTNPAGAARSKTSDSLKNPRPVVVKSLRTLSHAKPALLEDDDADTDKLMQTEPNEPGSLKPDLLWVLTAFFVLLLLAGSFVAFMMITSVKPGDIKPVSRFASPSASPSSDDILKGNGTMQIGDGHIPSPTPSPSPSEEAVATPMPAPIAIAPSAETSMAPPALPPAASLAPPPVKAMVTPPPLKPPSLPSKAPAKPPVDNTPAFRVVVGPFDSKDDADSASSELSDIGKTLKVEQDQGKFWLSVGDAYPSQDQALSLGEQLIQRGKQVTIKKK